MLNKFFDARKTILSNGLEIVTIKKDTQLMAISAGVKVGAINEEDNEKGISHFIEHIMFKGTDIRNNAQLNDELEKLGGEYNAYTDYLGTVYSIAALHDELENALEILSDMLINSVFPEKEIEKERGVILAEIKTSKDDIEDFSMKKVNEIAFKRSNLRYDTLGEQKTIKRFTRDHLISYYKKYYIPNNCCIVIASPYEHEKVINIVGKYFNKWKRQELIKREVIIEDNIPMVRRLYRKDIEQSTIVYLYTFNNLTYNEELALRILNHKFGDSSNSILFREVREKKGLAYDIYTHLDTSQNIKTLYIYTSVAEEDVEEAMYTIDCTIEKVKSKKIIFNDNILVHMKKVFKTALACTLEDSYDLCNYVLDQCMENEDIYQFITDMNSIENMKSSDIYDIAEKVLQSPTIHILQPEKSE
jgi:predicted Zn-dependent peptidase